MRVIRYGYEDGIPNMPDSFITVLYKQMEEDGTLPIVMYGIEPERRKAYFIRNIKCMSHLFWVGYADGMPGIISWANQFSHKGAFIHFCVFKWLWGNSVELGAFQLNYMLNTRFDNGYRFDVLKGMVPVLNTYAIRWAQDVGMTKIGTIPSACWIHDENRSVGGVVLYKEREQ